MGAYGFIYITTNLINNKKYIGQRKITSKQSDDKYLGSGLTLNRSIKKYGRDSFTREIIDYANTQQELDQKERYYIELNNATTDPMYYNVHEGGGGGNTQAGWSVERKKEFLERMSYVTSGENNGMYGRAHSHASRIQMSETRASRDYPIFQSEDFLQRMSYVTSGENNGMYGKHHTEEAKIRMSRNSVGKTSGECNGMYGKSGELAINGKPIYMYSDANHCQLVKEYKSMQCALAELGLKGHVSLCKAIKNNTIYKGYYWSKTLNV